MQVADFHCDTISALYLNQNKTENLKCNALQLDINKMRSAHYILQHFAIFVDAHMHDNPYETAIAMLDLYHKEIFDHHMDLYPITRFSDIDTAIATQKIAAIVTIEDGGILEGDINRLQTLYDKGVRLLTLTWNYENCIGAPSNMHYGTDIFPTEPNTSLGLTDFGRDVVEQCEQLGIIVDVSHLSDKGFYDVAALAKRPFVASHSSARTLCPHVRNATDDMIRTLANHGGLIGVNFHPDFISVPDKTEPNIATLTDIVRHIRHIYQIGGISCLALGSDFDGIDISPELRDASYMPMLFEALKKDGFHESEIDAIFFQNMLRFYKEY